MVYFRQCIRAFPVVYTQPHLEASTEMLPSLVGQKLDELPVVFALQEVWKALLHSCEVDGADYLFARLVNHFCRGFRADAWHERLCGS